MFKVKFRCDMDYDHKAPLSQLVEVDTITFPQKQRAIEFLMECTSPITKLADLECAMVATKKIGKKEIAL